MSISAQDDDMKDWLKELTARPGELLGVLRRELQVRLLNVSGSGCLLECERRIVPGTIGTLRLVQGEAQYSDDVRIVRCQRIEGGSSYHVGAEFVWTKPPHARSLRLAANYRGFELSAVTSSFRPM